LHPEISQGCGQSSDLRAQVGPGQLGKRPILSGVQQGRALIGCAPPDMRDEIQARIRKPHRTRHVAARQHTRTRRRRFDCKEVPDRGPERLEIGDRPRTQTLVVAKNATTLVREPAHEPGQFGRFDALLGRRPQQIALRDHGL